MPAGAAATAKAQGGVFWVESEACYGYVVRRGEAGARNRMSCKGYATAAEAEAARRGVLQAAQAAELNQPRHSARRGLYPSGFRAWQPAQMVERELQRQMLERREPAGSLFHAFVSQVMVQITTLRRCLRTSCITRTGRRSSLCSRACASTTPMPRR